MMTDNLSKRLIDQLGVSDEEARWLEQTQIQLEHRMPPFNLEGNWQRLATRIEAERKRYRATLPHRRTRWWWALMAYGLGAVTAAIVMTVMVPAPWEADKTVLPLGADKTVAQPDQTVTFQVVFSDHATIVQVRKVLAPFQAEIVAGPGRLGVWSVAVAASRADEAMKSLRSLPIVESVSR